MQVLRSKLGVFLSFGLLLCLMATILPLDALHRHRSETETVCKVLDGQTTCSHKAHLVKARDFCALCAVHYDKTFTVFSDDEAEYETIAERLLRENQLTAVFFSLLKQTLRGPPVQ